MSQNRYDEPLFFDKTPITMDTDPATIRSLVEAVLNTPGSLADVIGIKSIIKVWKHIDAGEDMMFRDKLIVLDILKKEYAFPVIMAAHEELFDE